MMDAFPNLTNYDVTSPSTPTYNCIAWAAGQDDSWWWPHPDYFWLPDLPLNTSVENFARLFERLGYEVCESEELEQNYDKVAIYAKDGECTHAARQLPDDRWTSKLGKSEDITHHDLIDLSGSLYGDVVRLLRRKR